GEDPGGAVLDSDRCRHSPCRDVAGRPPANDPAAGMTGAPGAGRTWVAGMPEAGLDDDGRADPAGEQPATMPFPGRPDGMRAMSSLPRIGAAPPAPGGKAERPDWLACLQETCELLWPPPAVVTVQDGKPGWLGRSGGQRQESVAAGPVSREFSLLGGISRPPLMVPGGR